MADEVRRDRPGLATPGKVLAPGGWRGALVKATPDPVGDDQVPLIPRRQRRVLGHQRGHHWRGGRSRSVAGRRPHRGRRGTATRAPGRHEGGAEQGVGEAMDSALGMRPGRRQPRAAALRSGKTASEAGVWPATHSGAGKRPPCPCGRLKGLRRGRAARAAEGATAGAGEEATTCGSPSAAGVPHSVGPRRHQGRGKGLCGQRVVCGTATPPSGAREGTPACSAPSAGVASVACSAAILRGSLSL